MNQAGAVQSDSRPLRQYVQAPQTAIRYAATRSPSSQPSTPSPSACDPSHGLHAEHVRELDRETGDTLADVDVEMVERRGRDVDDDLAVPRRPGRGAPRAAGRRSCRTRGRRPPSPNRSSLLLATPDLCLCLTSTTLSTDVDPRHRPLVPVRPGSDERKLSGALAAGADAVIADLEDAVVPEEKERARSVVTEAFAGGRGASLRLVRVNGARSPWHEDDLAAGRRAGRRRRRPAEGDSPRPCWRSAMPCRWSRSSRPPSACTAQRSSASAPQVESLMLGAIDLALELGLEARPDALELLQARSTIVLASAVARRRGPIDRVWVDVRDESGLEADCRAGRSLGFRGKSCIHPAQVAVVNEVFSPSPGRGRPCAGRGRRLRARRRPRGGAPSRSTAR